MTADWEAFKKTLVRSTDPRSKCIALRFLPVLALRCPTSTVSGTLRVTADSISSRTAAAVSSAASRGASNSNSSCTVRIIRARPPATDGSAAWTSIIAFLRMSAAEPWIGMLTAARSAAPRTWPFLLLMSGTSRRRPNIVLTTPVSARRLQDPVDERAHRREAGEVGVDEVLRLLARHADVLGQRERLLAVEQRVVDDLGAPAQLVRAQPAIGAEHPERGAVVNVLVRE